MQKKTGRHNITEHHIILHISLSLNIALHLYTMNEGCIEIKITKLGYGQPLNRINI